MRLKHDGGQPPMSAVEQLQAGWLDGLDRDTKATAWITLKLFVVRDRELFRRWVFASGDEAAQLLDQLKLRARTEAELLETERQHRGSVF